MKAERYTQELIDEYVSKGYWTTETYFDLWERNAREYPDREAVVDVKTRLTWSQGLRWIKRMALGFLQAGIKRDEVVICQLPNWVELSILPIALEAAGILFTPASIALRHSEMERLLKGTDAVGIVIPWEFGGFDFLNMIQEIRPNLISLRHVFVAGEKVPAGVISLKELTERPLEGEYPPDYLKKSAFSPTEITALAATTGTTGPPKIVGQSTAPNVVCGRTVGQRLKMTRDDIVIALTHLFGPPSGASFMGPPIVAAKTILLESFEPEEALRLIEKEKATIGAAVPAQLQMMVRHPNFDKYNISSLRAFYWAGAPLPYYMALEAEQKTRAIMVGGYGSWDGGGICFTSVEDPPEVRHLTVGTPPLGNEVRLVDEDGKEMTSGEIGEIQLRGPGSYPGYYKDTEATLRTWGAMGLEGWCSTGDMGRFDEQGNLVVLGRKTDVILSRGQEIYPVEIENFLLTNPKVLNVAVVGVPEPEMGEKACAFVMPKPGEKLTFEEMISFLKKKGITSYKLPQKLEIVEKFPMSADGLKVLKRELVRETTENLTEEGKSQR